jgi:hypothetical protein
MAGTEDADDTPLAERLPGGARRPGGDETTGIGDGGPDEEDLDAVTRLLGFLRGADDA